MWTVLMRAVSPKGVNKLCRMANYLSNACINYLVMVVVVDGVSVCLSLSACLSVYLSLSVSLSRSVCIFIVQMSAPTLPGSCDDSTSALASADSHSDGEGFEDVDFKRVRELVATTRTTFPGRLKPMSSGDTVVRDASSEGGSDAGNTFLYDWVYSNVREAYQLYNYIY